MEKQFRGHIIFPGIESGGDKMPGKKGLNGLLCLLLIGVIVAVNYFLPLRNADGIVAQCPARDAAGCAIGAWTLSAWLVTLVLLVLMLRAIGIALNDRPAGIIIDNRNRISLSKAQMVVWTLLILSALITLAATKLAALGGAPASLDISNTLLALMGISAASLIATPTLLSLKPAAVDSRGAAEEARWTDLVQGDDAANKDAVDISKVQQLLISLLVMIIYAFLIGNMLRYGAGAEAAAAANAAGTDAASVARAVAENAGRIGLPALSADLVWLIGISHVGYLGYKAVPHSSDPGNPAQSRAAARGAAGGGATG